ncbi:MAG: hypothetical protein HPY58_03585 [Firmicutes bacterium]|nr:hypothetical protein [Bacillota bacterium]
MKQGAAQKGLLFVVILGVLLTFFLPGEGRGSREKPCLPELAALLERKGVEIDGFDLEGWAVARKRGEAEEIWKELNLPGALGISGGSLSPVHTLQGEGMRFRARLAGGADVCITLQKLSKAGPHDLVYVMLKAHVPPGGQGSLLWEKRFRRALASLGLGSEHGLYLTVKGRLPCRLEPGARLVWGEGVLRDLGGSVTGSLETEKYLSLVGYTPFFSDAVRAGRKKVNINVALASPPGSGATFVYLGTPLISSEY